MDDGLSARYVLGNNIEVVLVRGLMLNDNVRFLADPLQTMLHSNNGPVKFFHVLCNHKQGTWSVKIDHYKEAVFTSEDKAECVAEAQRLAQESTVPKRRVLVRNTNGAVVEQVDC